MGCTGTFTDIAGATAATYDPPVPTANICYRRVDTDNCAMSMMTNEVRVTIEEITAAGIISANQAICSGDDPAALTQITPASITGPSTYQWQMSVGCTGTYTDIAGEVGVTYDPPVSTLTTCYRRVDSDNCGVSMMTNAVQIDVQGIGAAGVVANDQAICAGEDPVAFAQMTAPTVVGPMTFQWQEDIGCTGTFNDIPGATGATYDPGITTQTTCYRREDSGNCGNSLMSNEITITVEGIATAGAVSTDQAICAGDDPAALTETTAPSVVGAVTYQWQEDVGCTGAFADIVGATAATYDPGVTTQTTCYQRVDTDNCGNSLMTNLVTITVEEITAAGAISMAQLVCTGDVPAELIETTAPSIVGAVTYQWQEDVGCTGTFADIVGATAATYTPAAATQTTCYRRVDTDNCGNSLMTNAIQIDVAGISDAGTVTTSQIICTGDTPTELVEDTPAAAVGPIAYQWQESVGCTGTWSDIVGATMLTYTPPATTQTTCYRRVGTDNCGTSLMSNEITIEVAAVSSAGSIDADQIICSGGDPVLLNEVTIPTGVGALNYQWQIDPFCTGAWVDIPGATMATYDPPPPVTHNTCFRRVIKGLCGLTMISNEITIFIAEVTDAGTVSDDQLVCTGDDPVLLNEVTAATGIGALTYQWQEDPLCKGIWTDIPGATGATYDPPVPSATICYQRLTTDICNKSFASNIITIELAEVTDGGKISSDQLVCSTDDPAELTEIAVAAGVGPITYQWQEDPGCTGTWTDIAGATGLTYDPPVLAQTTCYQRLAISDCATALASSMVTIEVAGIADAGAISADQALCNGDDPTTLVETTAATGTGAITYQWQFSVGCTGTWMDLLGQTAASYDPPVPTETTCYRRLAVDVCGSTSATSTITITLDELAPTWDLAPNGLDGSARCDETLAIGTLHTMVPTASDNCPGAVSVVQISRDTILDATCAGSYVVNTVWEATDVLGNTSTFTQVITVTSPTCVLDDCTPVLAPVQLTVFDGYNQGNVNILHWRTEIEVSNDFFDLERSADGIDFVPLGRIKGAGTSFTPHNYQFIDEDPIRAGGYYRLRIVNFNGSFTYSNIVYIELGLEPYDIYPNPTYGELHYIVKSNIHEDIEIEIIDVLGRTLETQYATIAPGKNDVLANLKHLAAAPYFVQFRHLTSGRLETARIIKSN